MSSRFDLIAGYLLQKSFADCTIYELQKLILEQPYLAPAQFLLAKKMLHEGRPEARAQMQKAALYYHQPAAFDAFLNSEFPDLESFYKEETTDTETDNEPPLPIHLNLPEPTPVVSREIAEVQTIAPLDAAPINDAEPIETLPALQPPIIEIPETTPDARNENVAPSEVKNESNEPTTPLNQGAGLPAFEPYHTIDYFASQGIKLSQEEASKDKMGRQLKSFTEWLKTMKRLPATEQLKELDPNAEQKVEHLAAHSVVEAEIVTEAMAEVWLKQGNLDKAEAVYHKLSLSNPSKRAYFAAKLESLKKNV